MVSESRKQKIYDVLRRQVSARLTRTVGVTDGDLEILNLGEIINMVFLFHGDGGSTGNFSVSFGAALKLVGAELIWQDPPTNKVAISEQAELVN
jgi:hypothetical protein